MFDAVSIEGEGEGNIVRSIHLFVVMVGIVPTLIFAMTVWITGGAPFEPVGRPELPALTAPAALPPAPPMAVTGERAIAAQRHDPDMNRLERLARSGDAEAALLLTILDEPR